MAEYLSRVEVSNYLSMIINPMWHFTAHMCLLTGWQTIIYQSFRGLRGTAVMSSPATANGAKRATAEPDADAVKRLRADSGDGTGVETKPAAAQVPSAECWKLKKVLLLISYSGKGYLGMQR